ncbi:MAG TPA: hypothetical protein VEJ86_14830, partial [Candidatus Binataceae bacterium]|nr:hypothetical protein [Candidatus Binataceae bacterium]
MQLDFYAFDFQSTDHEAEERNYLGHHVALAKQTPGLKLYYTGRLIEAQGQKPERLRMAILGIDENEAAKGKLAPEVGAA